MRGVRSKRSSITGRGYEDGEKDDLARWGSGALGTVEVRRIGASN